MLTAIGNSLMNVSFRNVSFVIDIKGVSVPLLYLPLVFKTTIANTHTLRCFSAGDDWTTNGPS